jgi:hypothetical protein
VVQAAAQGGLRVAIKKEMVVLGYMHKGSVNGLKGKEMKRV